MAVAETAYKHITLDEQGTARIAGTRIKVILLVEAQQANGWNAEQLQEQYPFLTMGQIHSALAYYWDHKEEIDRDIEEELEFVDQMRSQTEPPPFIARLRAQGRIQ